MGVKTGSTGYTNDLSFMLGRDIKNKTNSSDEENSNGLLWHV